MSSAELDYSKMNHSKLNGPRNLVEIRVNEKGRAIYAKRDIRAGKIIEVSPVIMFTPEQHKIIDKTELRYHAFAWENGVPDKEIDDQMYSMVCIAMGYGTIFNHSFMPNARYYSDIENGVMVFEAWRDIKKGEEVLTNYNGNPYSQEPLSLYDWFTDDMLPSEEELVQYYVENNIKVPKNLRHLVKGEDISSVKMKIKL